MASISNEAKYFLGQLGKAKKEKNLGLQDWAYSEAGRKGIDLDKAATNPQYIGQLPAQRQAQGVGVTGPIDPGYSASLSTGSQYQMSPALMAQTAAAQQKQIGPSTSGTSALRPTSQPINIPQLINTIMQYKQPMLTREQEALNRQAKGAAQFINQQFAGRGTLHSGQRISEQEKLQEATMQTLADLMARARAEAVGEAYQFGGLQLQQQGQQFGQQESIANFIQRLAEFENTKNYQGKQVGIQEAGLTGMYQGQPTMEGQAQDFDQMQKIRNYAIAMEDRASQEIGQVTPGLANWLGYPELAGKPLAALEAIDAERKFELEKIRQQGANSLAVEQTRGEYGVAKEKVQQAGQNKRATYQTPGEKAMDGLRQALASGKELTSEQLRSIGAYVEKEDVDSYSEDVKGYIGWVAEGRFAAPGTPEALTGVLADIDGRIRAGLMPADYGEALKAGITAYFTLPEQPSTDKGEGFLSKLSKSGPQEPPSDLWTGGMGW